MKTRLFPLIAGLVFSLPVAAHPGHGLDDIAMHHLIPALGLGFAVSLMFLLRITRARRLQRGKGR